MRLAASTQEHDDAAGRRLQNRHTGQSVGWGPALAAMAAPVLAADLGRTPLTWEEALHQLVAKELERRGLIVPTEQAAGRAEEAYLDEVCPLKLPSQGFFHSPSAQFYSVDPKARVAVFGAPCDLGASKPGSRFGPKLLRERSLAFSYRGRSGDSAYSVRLGRSALPSGSVYDLGDLRLERRDLDAWLAAAAGVVSSLPQGVVPLMVGGDHTLTLGALRGLLARGERDFTVVQLDSHLDLQLWGEFEDGAPKRLDTAIHSNFMSHFKAEAPGVDVCQVGIREYQSIPEGAGAQVARYLERVGTQTTDTEFLLSPLESLLARLPKGKRVYLTIDVDALNASHMSTTGYPNSAGITPAQLLQVVRRVLSDNQVIGMDLMEFGGAGGVEPHFLGADLLCYLMLTLLEQPK